MLNLRGGHWHMLHSYLTANMDKVFDPLSMEHKVMNAEGADDRDFLPHFKQCG
jgi:hypothetical protein